MWLSCCHDVRTLRPSDTTRETRGLQPEHDGRVCDKSWLSLFAKNDAIPICGTRHYLDLKELISLLLKRSPLLRSARLAWQPTRRSNHYQAPGLRIGIPNFSCLNVATRNPYDRDKLPTVGNPLRLFGYHHASVTGLPSTSERKTSNSCQNHARNELSNGPWLLNAPGL